MNNKDCIIKKEYQFRPMRLEDRAPFVPKQGYCSIAPAQFYQDALISANSGIKMMIFGNPKHETVIFNHERLYEKKYFDNLQPPDIASVLPEVRKLLLEGKSKQACELSIKEARKQGYEERMPWHGDLEIPHSNYQVHSACAMKYDIENTTPIINYLRTLDFATGESVVHWEDTNGSYLRKSFVSGKNGVCIQKMETLRGDKGFSGTISITLDSILGKHDWERMDTPKDMAVTSTYSDSMLILGCKYNPETMGKKGYAVVTKIISEQGTVALQQNNITLCQVKNLTLLTLVQPLDIYSEQALEEVVLKLDQSSCDYAELLEYNQETLGRMMARSELSLNSEKDKFCSTEELFTLQHSSQELCPALMVHLYDIGRYFLITESGKVPPAIGQCNININLQVCSGNITNLSESMNTFFRFIEDKLEDFKLNAKNIFGCRGIVAPVHLDIDNGLATHFSSTWPHHYWISCAGWIYNEFWGHYLVTGDQVFLKERVIPGLREIALFFEDYLSDTDENGNYLFYPCFSPENSPGGDWSGVTINSCMDIMVCREVLENLITAYTVLGIETSDIEKWNAMLNKLPTYLADEEGALKEWAWESIPEKYNHRHVSHHYDVWPGNGITWEKTPNLAQAVLLSNRKRGQEDDSAHGIMHRLFTAIRLKDTPSAYVFLKQILERGFINRNMMTNHYPYAVYFPDITGSMPAALAEMFVYSNPGVIELLPATPTVLSKGEINGICCYTFAHIDHMEWDLNKGIIRVQITSLTDQTLKLRYRHHDFNIAIQGVSHKAQENSYEISLKKDETIFVKILIQK